MFSVLSSIKSEVYLGWTFYSKYILRKKLLENMQTFEFFFVSICNKMIITFPKSLIVSPKIKLPIDIWSCSNVRSLKVKNTSFHNCCKWQNRSFASKVMVCELLLIFYSNLQTIFSTLNALLQLTPPLILIHYLETSFSFKTPAIINPSE